MWLHTSGCSHSFQIDSTWTQKGLQLGFLLIPHHVFLTQTLRSLGCTFPFLSSSQDTLLFRESSPKDFGSFFVCFFFSQDYTSWPYLADLLVWLVKSALIFLSIMSFKTLILSSTCREFWSILFCYVHQWYVLSVIIVFIVAVTDASTQEDLSEFNAGKSHSFCRLIFAGISAFYPGQFLLYW